MSQRERWNRIFHLMVHFLDVRSKHGLARAKARGQESIWTSCMGVKNLNYLPGCALVGNWNKKRNKDLNIGIPRSGLIIASNIHL